MDKVKNWLIFLFFIPLFCAVGCGPGFTSIVVEPKLCENRQGCVTLAWDPGMKTDGSVQEVTGYRIHYGPSSGVYTNVVDVGNALSYTIWNLPPGVYYFAATSYLIRDGVEIQSGYSNEVNTDPNNINRPLPGEQAIVVN